MAQKQKKLNMEIKGNLQKLHFKFFAKRRANRLGLMTHKISHNNNGYIEIIVEGENTKLWEMVKWAKRGPLFSTVNEVVIQFTPSEIPVNVR